jgi:hypothetical protein
MTMSIFTYSLHEHWLKASAQTGIFRCTYSHDAAGLFVFWDCFEEVRFTRMSVGSHRQNSDMFLQSFTRPSFHQRHDFDSRSSTVGS